MELTKGQEQGLKIAVERFKNRDRFTVISGFAGSGKTTLVKYIVQALPGVDPEKDVCYATFTGKAAQVLLKKGNKNVSTLHKLLYESFPRPDGTFFRRPKPRLDYKIIVIDEVSMVPQTMIDLLTRHQVYCLYLGDPFQLPPVDKDDVNHLLDHPHVFLSEIMRQAQESEIIQLSMDIRGGRPIELRDGKEVKVYNVSDFSEGMLTWADQVLVATNATRIALNNKMRDLLGRTGAPQEGDKVICLKNYWETMADFTGDPLVNGTIGTLQIPYSTFVIVPYYLGGGRFDVLCSNFIADNGSEFVDLNMDQKMILTGDRCCDWKQAYKIAKSRPELLPKEFTYGYAITCHKAQGSSWENVLVVEEKFPFDKEEHARWLYTAVTRAEEKLVLIKK